MTDINWRDQAKCLGKDPELFFPIGDGPPAREQAAEAQRICGGCPVRDACARGACEAHLSDGIFGGFQLPRQKSTLRRHVEKLNAASAKKPIERRCVSCDAVMRTRIAVRLCGKCRTPGRNHGESTKEVREHLVSLDASPYRIAAAAGVGRTTIRSILFGEQTTAATPTIEALLSVTPEAVR